MKPFYLLEDEVAVDEGAEDYHGEARKFDQAERFVARPW
eukprot:CAMPEP_0202965668 /NCGR_PEP_ID=MMETSP1396-20130829/9617_1 /ASSEMBLY_ACC=CAM_ASM_000872 /TAXON_ID= /ORGANISM="Pseudokeronopsis sp., Strain Brazil" /LENGTH=38 /DNA_ID= /DNA_START= /DNA_END= /DNA_ORIENTATION=